MCFSILVEWIYLRYWKMKWWEWLAILAASMVVYKVAASRTSSYTFYLIYLLFALAVIAPKLYKIKLVKFLFTISTPVIAAVSFVMVILYMKGNSIGIAINEMLTGRLEFAAQFLNEYGVSLFGQEVELVSTRAAQELHISTAILDMSYIRAPIVYGIIFSVFFLVSFILLEKRAMKKGDIGIALFALFYIILGVAETYTIIPVFNISMLLMLNTYRSGFNELLEKIYKYKNLFS
jgi:hypothetical protein